jgi:ribose 5-phosphate isomerase RpiB
VGKPSVFSKVKHWMSRVFCPTGAGMYWANSSNKGLRCTKCGQTGHGTK